MKTVVFTFDDGLRSHMDFAVPLLKKHGFGATFFVCLQGELSLDEIKILRSQGFEIGNHFDRHIDIRKLSPRQIARGVNRWNFMFEGIDVRADSFCPPGFHYNDAVIDTLRSMFKRVRLGCSHHIQFDTYQAGGSGAPFPVCVGDLHAMPCSVVGHNYCVENFVEDIVRLKEGETMVFCFHDFVSRARTGTTDWTYEQFEECVDYLQKNNYSVISLEEIDDRAR